MKNLFYFIVFAVTVAACNKTEDNPEVLVNVHMGTNHVNDVYYSLEAVRTINSVRSD